MGRTKSQNRISTAIPVRTRRVPKPAIVIAVPASDHAVVTIDRLKGGELTWSIRTPGPSLPAAIKRAVAQARDLQRELDFMQEGWKRMAAEKAKAAMAEAGDQPTVQKGPNGGQ